MSASSLSIEDLTARRKKAIQKNEFCTPLFAMTCQETRIGVVIARSHFGGNKVSAYYFRPAQMNRGFAKEDFQGSAHDYIEALARAKEKIAHEKAEKVAPHDFKVGDIIASVWGYTSRDVNFYKVVKADKPREITAVELRATFASGDWMAGTKIPTDTVIGAETTFKTQVVGGKSTLKSNSITSASKWSGNPISVHCD